MESNLENLLTLSRQLLRCAESGSWSEVVDIEAQRRPLLFQIFPPDKSPPDDLPAASRQAVEEILAADRRVVELAQQRQTEIADQLREIAVGRVAVKAYADTGSSSI